MNTPASTPPQTSVLFARGVIARLSLWATLRIAIQLNWGGPHGLSKRRWLASSIVDSFEEQITNPPDDIYIEQMLLQVMEDEFEVVVEDGSTESVSKDIVRLWEETRDGSEELVNKFEKLADKATGSRVNAQEQVVDVGSEDEEGSEEGDDDEAMDIVEDDSQDAPQLLNPTEPSVSSREPLVDQDGFTLVQKKKRP